MSPARRAPGPAREPAPSAGPLSYTALALYARCAYRFYAQRVVGLPDVPPPGSRRRVGRDSAAPAGLDARARGVLVHALLRDVELRGAQPAAPTVARIRDRAQQLGLAVPEVELAHVDRLLRAFVGSGPARRLARATGVAHEREFAFELVRGAGPLLTGAVDLLGVEADRTWLIVDAKTDAVEPSADLASLTEREYGIQRRLYALAALRAGAQRAEVVHAYLERPGEPASVVFGPDDEPALVGVLRELSDGVADGRFAVTDAPHAALCATCPARDTLCPHPRGLTLRATPGPVERRS